jgi:hypothetical protein
MRRSESVPFDATPAPPDRDLAAEAVEVFQPHYPERLTPDDGKAIVRNLVDVLSLLSEWKREATPRTADPAPDVAASPGISPTTPARRPRGRKFPAEIP